MLERELTDLEMDICKAFSRATAYSCEAVVAAYRRVQSYDSLEVVLIMAIVHHLALPDAAPEIS